jgi:hypothetical protein
MSTAKWQNIAGSKKFFRTGTIEMSKIKYFALFVFSYLHNKMKSGQFVF